MNKTTKEMLNKYPGLRKTWKILGSPDVERSLVPGQYACLCRVTPEMSRALLAADLFTPRDPDTTGTNRFGESTIQSLAKKAIRRELIPFIKEIAICGDGGNIVTGNHYLLSTLHSNIGVDVRLRFGSTKEEGAADGKQRGWRPNQILNIPKFDQKVVTGHFRQHENIRDSGLPEKVALAWWKEHQETIKLVREHMAYTPNGGLAPGCNHAALHLALVEAVERTHKQPEIMRRFLVAFRANDAKVRSAFRLRTWMEANGLRFSNQREKLYGGAVSLLKGYLAGNHDVYLNVKGAWESEKKIEDVKEPLESSQVRAAMRALKVRRQVAEAVVYYVTSSGTNFDAGLRQLGRINSNILDMTVNDSLCLAKRMAHFSTHAMTSFCLANINNPALVNYLTGTRAQVLAEDWKPYIRCLDRMSLDKTKMIEFDRPWLDKHFRNHCTGQTTYGKAK